MYKDVPEWIFAGTVNTLKAQGVTIQQLCKLFENAFNLMPSNRYLDDPYTPDQIAQWVATLNGLIQDVYQYDGLSVVK